MRFAVIAAGDGSRLVQEGVEVPKPLVKICGEPLIDRLLREFMECGATSVAVICNGRMPEVEAHLVDIKTNGLDGFCVPIDIVVRNTPSSMHSFHELAPLIAGGPFCLTTVDTIFLHEEFARYIETLKHELANGCDGVMGVTAYVDDEKPLYVGTYEDGMVNGFYDDPHQCRLVSGGIYGLAPVALDVLQRCVASGQSRMRNFQRAMVTEGLRLKAFEFGKVLDIDHTSDIAKAEAFLGGTAL